MTTWHLLPVILLSDCKKQMSVYPSALLKDFFSESPGPVFVKFCVKLSVKGWGERVGVGVGGGENFYKWSQFIN